MYVSNFFLILEKIYVRIQLNVQKYELIFLEKIREKNS